MSKKVIMKIEIYLKLNNNENTPITTCGMQLKLCLEYLALKLFH